jgi:lysophospholipid acyltransferase (LPLAT)-like uncharacterized protein
MALKVMVSRDCRGDCVAVLCRWLGFEVVRGDAEHGAWKALIEIGRDLHEGAVLISPDGNGPAFFARLGAEVLSSAAGAPLIPIGADCRPALLDKHKWDLARYPMPFCRIAVACGDPITFLNLNDGDAVELARQELEKALSSTAKLASTVLSEDI